MNRLNLRYILCPVDLSSLSINSLEWANAIARARSAELRALQVVVTEGLVAPEPLGSLERGDMMMKLREALAAIASDNVHTGAAIRQGDPGTEILKFAASLPADVVVMGAAGAERATRPMGSLATAVVARCDCPVPGRARGASNRSRDSRRLQTDFVRDRLRALFHRRHQASALARMGNTWTRDIRVRHHRTHAVSVGDSGAVVGGDSSRSTRLVQD